MHRRRADVARGIRRPCPHAGRRARGRDPHVASLAGRERRRRRDAPRRRRRPDLHRRRPGDLRAAGPAGDRRGATLRVRASQGGNRRCGPRGRVRLGVGRRRPVVTQPNAGVVTVALPPGAHVVELAWRESRGVGLLFRTRTLSIEGDGVNASTVLSLAPDRVVLAAGGPRIGPAVLFWAWSSCWPSSRSCSRGCG